MNTSTLKDIPAHVYLLSLTLILLAGWEIRPDQVIQNLLLQSFGAYLGALVPVVKQSLSAPTSPPTPAPTAEIPTTGKIS